MNLKESWKDLNMINKVLIISLPILVILFKIFEKKLI